MKVWELKKINEFAQKNNISLEYDKLLEFKQEDINRVIEAVNMDDVCVGDFIVFLQCELDGATDWQLDFMHLEGIENFDIRKYLIEKILNASSKEQATEILNSFDAVRLELFRTVKEWKTYIDNIFETMIERNDLTIDNVSLILETQEEDRIDLIKQVMEYSQRGDLDSTMIRGYFNEEIISKKLKEILSLLIKGYNIEKVSNLFIEWAKQTKNIVTMDGENKMSKLHELNTAYSLLIDYLKNSTLFCSLDNSSLIGIFCGMDYQEYARLILLFQEIEQKNDRKLFEHCLVCHYMENENMQYYIRNILKNTDSEYIDSLYYLWNENVIERNISSKEDIERIVAALQMADVKDGSSMDMANFLVDIPFVEIMKDMYITKENRETREVLYNEFPKFIVKEVPLSDEQIENYRDWLTKLSNLPEDVCQKVMKIINISIIKNMNIEEQNKIKELVLTPENFGSLEYIYDRYKEKEQEFNEYHLLKNKPPVSSSNPTYESEVQLVTVVELLESYDIDKILDGFPDDEEITPKTLIRTMAYKNNKK